MLTRYNYKWTAPAQISCPIKKDFELVKKIIPVSFNEDKSVKEYTESEEYVVRETKWQDFIDSFDVGSISEQIMDHITKGTPLITGHVLPDGDYTPESLEKGARLKRELDTRGITIDMIAEAIARASGDDSEKVAEVKEASAESEAK